MKQIKKQINKMLETEENKLKVYVLNDLLEQEKIKSYLEDLRSHGCVSGMVSSLIYYADTNQFYKDYEEEIEDLIDETMESLGIDNRFEFIGSLNGSKNVGNLQQELNLLAWFAYEEIAYQIYIELFESD